MHNHRPSRPHAPANLYQILPSVSDLLLHPEVSPLLTRHPRRAVVRTVQDAIETLRGEIAQGRMSPESLAAAVEHIPASVLNSLSQPAPYSLRRVLNATGVILHTNLGRAPLSQAALEHAVNVAAGYCNLEFDLASGQRGTRDQHVEALLLSVLAGSTGISHLASSHRAIVVNNCAAATFLALRSLAQGREVLVSRGELIEIGGGFRIPEILEASGAILKEVGTTNRTRAGDYERALSTNTALILSVHQSNFSIEGFVEKPELGELIALGRRAQVPVFVDQGTGLIDASHLNGLGGGEMTVADPLAAGGDLIAASGDKLLGGPQCGILIGRSDLIGRIRRDPLFRTFRIDKLIYAALEATLLSYRNQSFEDIPVLRMLMTASDAIRLRCEQVSREVNDALLEGAVVPVQSVVGGGTAPKTKIVSFAVSLLHRECTAAELLRALRQTDPPVVARVEDERVLLDLRTVDPSADHQLVSAVKSVRPRANHAPLSELQP